MFLRVALGQITLASLTVKRCCGAKVGVRTDVLLKQGSFGAESVTGTEQVAGATVAAPDD